MACVAALGLIGRRPYVTEFTQPWRQVVAAILLVGILALAVLQPVTAFGAVLEIETETLWFPTLFVGHAMLATFLFLWWRLRDDISLASFVGLSLSNVAHDLRIGLAAGGFGWLMTVMVTLTIGSIASTIGQVGTPTEVPEFVVWLVELPIAQKLIIIGIAMTIEEAFFRGFLQARFGLLVSSVLFALSHFSYGLPYMIVGVFTISLVIGRTFERTGNLLPCMVAHGVFDAIQLLVVLPWVVRQWTANAA